MREPTGSPWGEIQDSETLCPGITMITAPGHGGIMVAPEAIGLMSSAAIKCGVSFQGFRCFDEDITEYIVLRELLDKKLWEIPDRITDKAGFEKSLDQALQEYFPDYWKSRIRCLKQKSKTLTPHQTKAPKGMVR